MNTQKSLSLQDTKHYALFHHPILILRTVNAYKKLFYYFDIRLVVCGP